MVRDPGLEIDKGYILAGDDAPHYEGPYDRDRAEGDDRVEPDRPNKGQTELTPCVQVLRV